MEQIMNNGVLFTNQWLSNICKHYWSFTFITHCKNSSDKTLKKHTYQQYVYQQNCCNRGQIVYNKCKSSAKI